MNTVVTALILLEEQPKTHLACSNNFQKNYCTALSPDLSTYIGLYHSMLCFCTGWLTKRAFSLPVKSANISQKTLLLETGHLE